MSNYVLAFRGLPDRQGSPDDDTAWGAWFGSLGGAIIDSGHRVAQVTTIAAEGGGTDTNVLTGYLVITADDIDAASRLARGCPGLANGVSVEVAQAIDA